MLPLLDDSAIFDPDADVLLMQSSSINKKNNSELLNQLIPEEEIWI